MKAYVSIGIVLVCVIACDSGTSPEQISYFWEDLNWVSIEGFSAQYCDVFFAVQNDSLYVMGVQVADTSDYYKCNFPDLVSINIYDEIDFEEYTIDGNTAHTADSELSTDDWFGSENTNFQTDASLGGTNDVIGIFLGEVNGDSTVVFRKATVTGDFEYDTRLLSDSTFGLEAYLQWGDPGDSLFFNTVSDINPVTF